MASVPVLFCFPTYFMNWVLQALTVHRMPRVECKRVRLKKYRHFVFISRFTLKLSQPCSFTSNICYSLQYSCCLSQQCASQFHKSNFCLSRAATIFHSSAQGRSFAYATHRFRGTWKSCSLHLAAAIVGWPTMCPWLKHRHCATRRVDNCFAPGKVPTGTIVKFSRSIERQ